MSEEILKALTQLFAIITKQDGGVTAAERQFVQSFFQAELDQASLQEYMKLYDEYSGYHVSGAISEVHDGKPRQPSVQDSLKTLNICKKINKTLAQRQKVIVLIKLMELLGSDRQFSQQRIEIINTVSTVFNISPDDHKLIEVFVTTHDVTKLEHPDLLVVDESDVPSDHFHKHVRAHLEGSLVFLRVRSVDMYFVKYLGHQDNYLNGFIMGQNRVYLFSQGSTIKTQYGDAHYYSDLVSNFNEELQSVRLSFNAQIKEFRFPNGQVGLRNITLSEGPGKLIGIMGSSGAGKTTLLNALAGIEMPSDGKVLINGFNLYTQKDKIQGVIGYVAQDDLLIEELTVYENLYYSAKLCFADFTEQQLNERVLSVLESLGLEQRKDLKVGGVLSKTISGGQRKRLNIALELIREPAVLFVDEPTSGLSSRDSENVIDLLKELSLKGKLVFVVIHQPSSDIYKMFDKMLIMDTGGYPVFYGNPVEAVTYFKKATHQADSHRGQCETCGNVNPEQIFNITEAKVVDEYGQPTSKRKITPEQWHERYARRFATSKVEDVKDLPPSSLNLPSRLRQTLIFTARDFRSKISNTQYLLINLLEAPLLAFLLAFIIRYRSAPGGQEYLFRFNENIPAFLMMAVIVALFMGLTVSAEEIIRDRKILKRESFLNLSWNSYLQSKVILLFTLSAIQTLTFIVIGNLLLEIRGMTLAFWGVLFATSCMANVLGLNISSAFNSAVTVYILIPLLLIPQMVLSGLLFSFDRLHHLLSTKGKVPLVADLMASRWAYEAMAVHQYTSNTFEKPIYFLEKVEAQSDFKATFLADELLKRNEKLRSHWPPADEAIREDFAKDLAILKHYLVSDHYQGKGKEALDNLTVEKYSPAHGEAIESYILGFKAYYQDVFNKCSLEKDKMIGNLEAGGEYNNTEFKNLYFNEGLSDLVRNVSQKERITEYQGELIAQIDPIYHDPKPSGALDYRAQFFAPVKYLFGAKINTYVFNLAVIWIMAALLYVTLYFEWLRKGIDSLSRIGLRFRGF
jgi:ABC-type multidrug transport system ATPase subunit